MKEVIRIDIPQATDNPVVFTHYLSVERGWGVTDNEPSGFERVVYLGPCTCDGDMFATYTAEGHIDIFKGHLNSGRY